MYNLGPEIIKLFSCSTQLSKNFFPLINVKMPKLIDILTFMSRTNNTLGLSEPEKAEYLDIYLWASKILCSAKLSMKKVL